MPTGTKLKKFEYVTISNPPFSDCTSALSFLANGSYMIENLYHINGLEPNPKVLEEARKRKVTSEERVDMDKYPEALGGSLFNMKSCAGGSNTGLGLDVAGNWRMILFKEVGD